MNDTQQTLEQLVGVFRTASKKWFEDSKLQTDPRDVNYSVGMSRGFDRAAIIVSMELYDARIREEDNA